HDLALRTDRFPRRAHDRLIRLCIHAAERSPSQLKGAKALRPGRQQPLGELSGIGHQHGGVGLDPLFIAPAEQAADWLAGDFAKDVPERDVYAADGMGDSAAATLPEGVLMQLLGDALRLNGAFAYRQWA